MRDEEEQEGFQKKCPSLGSRGWGLDLRDEEEQEGFGKVSQHTHNRKRHARKVAEGVAHKHLRGELVVLEETQGHKNKRNDDSHGEDMVRHYFWGGSKIDLLYKC